MPKKLYLASSLTLILALSALAYAQDATPPRPAWQEPSSVMEPKAAPSAKPVTAIVVRSWGDNPVWADLNTNWSTYGKIPVSIDHSTLIISDFTYQDLVKSKANVIIISDAAGGIKQYSPAEIAAIAKYAKSGHTILGTYATLQYASTDNRGLAPVFGLNAKLTYNAGFISGKFISHNHACLLNKIPGTWQSNGYNQTQVPSSGSWKGNFDKAKPVAGSDAYNGAISVYTTTAYTGIYVSNMPEYINVGGSDEQLLYNALTCYVK